MIFLLVDLGGICLQEWKHETYHLSRNVGRETRDRLTVIVVNGTTTKKEPEEGVSGATWPQE